MTDTKEAAVLANATVSLELPGKPEYISLARMDAAALGNMLGFPIDVIEDIKVALSEACTNALRYGCTTSDSYKVHFFIDEEGLAIEVSDRGTGYDFDLVATPQLGGEQIGGFGLFIIRSLMDSLDIVSSEENGTTIRMKKKLRPDN